MSNRHQVADQPQRDEALDPARSFIVQAPAGSGKTGLITQRFLVLLALVEKPEEVVAITFTRKAAGEMRQRILEALQSTHFPEPENLHDAKTWRLATAAMARNEQQGWDLLNHPARLSIQTIDSLCASLTRQLPLLSRFGAQPAIAEDSTELYRQAAQQTLSDLEKGEDWSPAIESLLRHLDNDLALAESMLVSMLARRDQWLRHLVNIRDEPERRSVLEHAFSAVIEDVLAELDSRFPAELNDELIQLVRYAADNVADTHRLADCRDLQQLPATTAEALKSWNAIANLLLTNEGGWRSRLDKSVGFPAPSNTKDKAQADHYKQMKQRGAALIANLSEDDVLRMLLDEVRYLPDPQYKDTQWNVVEAMCELLVVAVAHLRLVFANRGEVDFSEISQSAIVALGESDAPTDLALAMDYRIQHLLVDEFQDTSFGQYALLERLTAGWQKDDGRTLFLVGDPMQSIYRFREAEVGLYLRARQQGIGDIPLQPLTLSVNFRSQAGVIDWFNQTFNDVLPQTDDVGSGAVSYSPSTAFHAAQENDSVKIHPAISHDPEAEAQQIVKLVQQAYNENPQGSVAILVRARSHLASIVPALKRSGLSYRAIDIEQLTHRPVVQDLFALTRALLHPADRVAWLALLRAPWCGLSLVDLERLTANNSEVVIWDALQNDECVARLSDVGRQRVIRLQKIFSAAIANRRRLSFRRWLEGVWLSLGGPVCVETETDLDDADVFFQLVQEMESGADLESVEALSEQLTQLFALPDVDADPRLQLMTIHKSKGLEFDTVILPGLGRKAPPDENRLLMWMERTSQHEENELLLAPVQPAGEERDATYAYIKRIDRRKAEYESGRLLYVAATRAKQCLHLLGHTTLDEKKNEVRKPQSSSLLRLLWPHVAAQYTGCVALNEVAIKNVVNSEQIQVLRRLQKDWQLPDPPASIVFKKNESGHEAPEEDVDFVWASDVARHIGTVVHAMLQRIANEGLAQWSKTRVKASRGYFTKLLRAQGVVEDEIDNAVARVEQALLSTLEDERGCWILDVHQEHQSEYALSGMTGGYIQRIIIDRTFIDEEGRRWIIDYKTGSHEGAGLQAFIDSEQERYRGQLERYAELIKKRESHPVMLALYFPMLAAWRAWEY